MTRLFAALIAFSALCSCQKKASFLEVGRTYEGWAIVHEPDDTGYKKFTVEKIEDGGWIRVDGHFWLNISAFSIIKEAPKKSG